MVLSLASTALPKSIRDEVDHASDIEELPPSYASVRSKIIDPPAGKTNSANGLDAEWDGEIVETLEQLFAPFDRVSTCAA